MAVLPRFGSLALVALLGVVGCAGKQPPRKTGEGGTTTPAMSIPGGGPSAHLFAKEFLQSVNRGEVKFDQVSPAFLKVIAEPGILPSDVARGYDEDAAKQWFKSASGVNYAASDPLAENGTRFFVGDYTGNNIGRYVLRLVQMNGAWKVDWFQRIPVTVTTVNLPIPAPNLLAAEGAFAAILAMKNDADTRFAAALLTPELRRQLGPPFASDATRGYNLGALRSNLQDLAGGAKVFTLAPAESGTFKGKFLGGKSPELLVKVVESQPGVWLVSEIKPE